MQNRLQNRYTHITRLGWYYSLMYISTIEDTRPYPACPACYPTGHPRHSSRFADQVIIQHLLPLPQSDLGGEKILVLTTTTATDHDMLNTECYFSIRPASNPPTKLALSNHHRQRGALFSRFHALRRTALAHSCPSTQTRFEPEPFWMAILLFTAATQCPHQI